MNCSEILVLFSGNRILTLGEVPKDQVYSVKLKGVSVCFAMLKAVLSGNYVNFGVFRLYGDDALDNALQTFIKLLLSIPHSDLLVRSSTSVFTLTLYIVFAVFLHWNASKAVLRNIILTFKEKNVKSVSKNGTI